MDTTAPRSSLEVRAFWVAVAAVWVGLIALYAFTVEITSPVDGVVLVAIGVISSAVWLGGIRYLAMWAVGVVGERGPRRSLDGQGVADRSAAHSAGGPVAPGAARVVLLYCTADDFNGAALRESMRQQHPVTTVILDDSVSLSARDEVDGFAESTSATVIRRPERTGFKAGNLNHALSTLADRFDYFVVMDSDGVLPSDFVTRALAGFHPSGIYGDAGIAGDRPDPNGPVGIVQARHHAERGSTAFTSAFAGLLGTHVAVTQRARSTIGFATFMGRGGMISTDCFRAAGPFPEVVTEDLAFSLEARLAGYRIVYDHSLVCTEDYPIDYHAFRTQHAKFVEGSIEFLRQNWRRVLASRLTVLEKVDLLLEQLMVPLAAAAGVVLMLSALALAALGGTAQQPAWSIAATALCAAAPLLPETARLARKQGILAAAAFLALAGALYGSTFLVTLRSSARVLSGGSANFRVTPKTVRRSGRWSTVVALRLELAAATAAVTSALVLTGTFTPALPLAATAVAALGFARLGAIPAGAAAVQRMTRLATR